MAVEAGVDFTVRERIVNEYVKLHREVWPADAHVPMLEHEGGKLADGILRVMDLMGDEPEVVVFLHRVMMRHVDDPHGWDDTATVVALLKWRRDGAL